MTLDNEVKSLQALPMFRGVEPAKLKLLAFASERLSYRAGDRFFRQGDVSDSAYVILSGGVDVLLETGADRIRVAQIPRGSIVGEMGVLSGSPRSATIEASEATEALRIRKDLFFDLLNEFPQIAVAVMRDLAVRLEKTNAQLSALRKG
ncbi:MAG TPA: Crp/Fnr family transcriptional regulator [Beijerinckiaceae bacterium]|nr:Crp/Fnr family transcriptional regulator [Beijerinckiaceae bacterium]